MSDFKTLFGQTNNNQDEKKNDIISEQNNTSVDDSNILSKNTNSQVINTTTDGKYECEDVDVFNFVNINKSFGDFKLFDNLNLTIKDFKDEGQFITFIGQSGCGKTQLLKMISGISKPDSGKIMLYGKEIKESDNIPMVFQQYSSFEWMTVLENIALPMKLAGIDKKTREERARKIINLIGLDGSENKYCRYGVLSGGMLQRASIGRALACDSKLLMLDEYSSGLDYFTKFELQDLLLKIFNNRDVDRTFLMVTHDISEAVYLSNRIYILEPKPCRIKDIIDIKFSQPRTQAIRETDEFKDYYTKVLNALNETVK